MRVSVFSRKQFNELMLREDITTENVEKLNDYFFISIIEPEGESHFTEDRENVKIMKFYDLDEDMGKYKAFTEEQAKELFDFIAKHGDKKHCFVHCAAGVSRSGAVGTFVNDHFGGDYNEFKQRHSHILPNALVLSLLRREARKD